jgi:type IX secretion system PorP/SprF family membrane protein
LLFVQPLWAQFNTSRIWSDFYVYDLKLINPAFSGTSKEQQIVVAGDWNMKSNWYAANSGYVLSYDGNIPKLGGALGVVAGFSRNRPRNFFSNDRYYQQLTYTYKAKISDHSMLGIGGGVNLNQHLIDFQEVGQPIYSTNPLPVGSAHVTNLDFDFGLSYQFKSFLTGVSVQNIAASKIDYTEDFSGGRNTRQVNVYGQTSLRLSPFLKLEPGLRYTWQPSYRIASSIMDFNVFLFIKDSLFFGAKMGYYYFDPDSEIVGNFNLYGGCKINQFLQIGLRANFPSSRYLNTSYFNNAGAIGLMLKTRF